MAYYLAFDGGGSKFNGMLFDDNMTLISSCRSGGISTTQGTPDDCRANIERGLDELFSGFRLERVEKMFYTGVGAFPKVVSSVSARVKIKETVRMSEALGGLLAGALKREGILALSGTGSDVFYVSADGKQDMVGGWGPILGDDGSGVWIGQQAVRAVVRSINGWGEETALLPMIREEWKLEKDWDMVDILHCSSAAPLRKVGSLTPIVGRAAAKGDKVALSILREAGRLMAAQTEALILRNGLGPNDLDVTLCGGAWKSHQTMLDAYLSALKPRYPTLTTARPIFEHVICGPALLLLDAGMPRLEAIGLLKTSFPKYICKDPCTES